jgi:hypothetical protein
VTTYYVEINHDEDPDVDLKFRVQVFEAGETQADRTSIAWALRRAADLIEKGHPVAPTKLN